VGLALESEQIGTPDTLEKFSFTPRRSCSVRLNALFSVSMARNEALVHEVCTMRCASVSNVLPPPLANK
jgi:hypothetical protein